MITVGFHTSYEMAADRYYGYGHGHGHGVYGYPPGPPRPGFPMGYPGGLNVAFPAFPTYFYPPHGMPNNDAGFDVAVVDDGPTMPGETVELPYSTYRWVPACLSQKSLPMGALRVGVDIDGDAIYAGRAHHSGDLLPAKIIPSKNAAYVCYSGEEVLVDQFEVLVPSMFSWQFATGGNVPPGAVEAGVTVDGEKLFYGRVSHDGCTTPGKIQGSHGVCYYPFDGEERSSPEYEALVLL